MCSSLKRSQPVCSWGTGARMFPKNTWQALGHVPHAVGRASLLTDQHCRPPSGPLPPAASPLSPRALPSIVSATRTASFRRQLSCPSLGHARRACFWEHAAHACCHHSIAPPWLPLPHAIALRDPLSPRPCTSTATKAACHHRLAPLRCAPCPDSPTPLATAPARPPPPYANNSVTICYYYTTELNLLQRLFS